MNKSPEICARQQWLPSGDRGQILVLVAIFLPFLLGMVGLALDVGELIAHRTERQRTADAAALAG